MIGLFLKSGMDIPKKRVYEEPDIIGFPLLGICAAMSSRKPSRSWPALLCTREHGVMYGV